MQSPTVRSVRGWLRATVPTLLLWVFGLGCTPRPSAEQLLVAAGRATVVMAVVDLRERPASSASIADQALLGDLLRVLPPAENGGGRASGDWLQVATDSDYRGWVQAAALRPVSAGEAAYRAGGPLLRVVTRLASVYEQPTVTANRPLLLVSVDSQLRLLREQGERWREILLPDGRHGFVQAGDVVAATEPIPSAACILEHAQLYGGTPYLWGGRSTLGIDCSGLVASAFLACGVVLPRDAGPQFASPLLAPVPLDPAALQPADLLFFGEKKASGTPPTISHVGIYLGAGRFLDATTYRRPTVHDDSLADPHWQPLWVGARRYAFP